MSNCSGSPSARLSAYKNAAQDVESLDGLKSYYADRGCAISARQIRWIFYKNNVRVYQTAFQRVGDSIPIGTGSTAAKLLLPGGDADILTYLGTIGVATTTGDLVRVFIEIKNCRGEKDMGGYYDIIVHTDCCGDEMVYDVVIDDSKHCLSSQLGECYSQQQNNNS